MKTNKELLDTILQLNALLFDVRATSNVSAAITKRCKVVQAKASKLLEDEALAERRANTAASMRA